MPQLEPGTSPPCSWCGAAAEGPADSAGNIMWECDSTSYRGEPLQSDGCYVLQLESENATMRELLGEIVKDYDLYPIYGTHLRRARELLATP